MDLALGYNNCGCTLNQLDNKVDPHLCGEHGDVMKLSTSSLFDRDSQEESVAIFGENRFLVLQKAKMHQLQGVYHLTHSCLRLGVNTGQKSDFPTMSDFELLL